MLMGMYQNSIDTKCRMIVPSKYRDELGYKCVVTKGIDKCLYIFTADEWERFKEKLSALPSSDPNARQLVRHYFANASECEIDKQGRITIPQVLRDYAGIEKDLVTVGIMNKIEIWSKSEWDKSEGDTQLTPSELAQRLEAYGI